jgi:hypothetical protein
MRPTFARAPFTSSSRSSCDRTDDIIISGHGKESASERPGKHPVSRLPSSSFLVLPRPLPVAPYLAYLTRSLSRSLSLSLSRSLARSLAPLHARTHTHTHARARASLPARTPLAQGLPGPLFFLFRLFFYPCRSRAPTPALTFLSKKLDYY